MLNKLFPRRFLSTFNVVVNPNITLLIARSSIELETGEIGRLVFSRSSVFRIRISEA